MANCRNQIAITLWALLLAPGIALAQQSLIVDSTGNVGVGTDTPNVSLHVVRDDGTARVDVEDNSGTEAERVLLKLRNKGNARFFLTDYSFDGGTWQFTNAGPNGFVVSLVGTGGPEMRLSKGGGLRVGPGGAVKFEVTASGDVKVGGSIVHASSRTQKEGIEPVDPVSVLEKVNQLPISKWSYIKDNGEKLHMGPMSEDFWAAFGLGINSRTISSADAVGVALAAIKGLKSQQDKVIAEKELEIEALKKTQEEQKAELESLKEMLKTLTTSGPVAANDLN